jgi:adenine-specific DNA-methyltransferase
MKFIGNKWRLLGFIDAVLRQEGIQGDTVCDIFSGTTSVAQYFKERGYRVIANDIMYFSYVFENAFIKTNSYPGFSALVPTLGGPRVSPPSTIDLRSLSGDFPVPFRTEFKPLWTVINHLNGILPQRGFIYENYSPEGTQDKKYRRQYFTAGNAMKIDAIRDQIQAWLEEGKITENEFHVLLTSLLDSADFVANNSGTYGAFLKIWRSMALKLLTLKVLRLIQSSVDHEVYQQDANRLIRRVSCDILYVDPPYNARQYATNYHLLETIARWDNPEIYGKTGLRPYEQQKSDYSMRSRCATALADLVHHADCDYILMSYNDEGLIPHDRLVEILQDVGNLRVHEKKYKRFRSESDRPGRTYKKKSDLVIERLYCVRL